MVRQNGEVASRHSGTTQERVCTGARRAPRRRNDKTDRGLGPDWTREEGGGEKVRLVWFSGGGKGRKVGNKGKGLKLKKGIEEGKKKKNEGKGGGRGGAGCCLEV